MSALSAPPPSTAPAGAPEKKKKRGKYEHVGSKIWEVDDPLPEPVDMGTPRQRYFYGRYGSRLPWNDDE